MPIVTKPEYQRPQMANPSPIGSDHTPIPVRSQTTHPSYKATAIDTDRVDRTTILSHIEGSPWAVTLFVPVIGKDQAAIGQQQGASPIHQQYHVIRDFELRVQSDLKHSQEQESGDSNVSGTSVVYPFVVPNKGTMFTAPMFDGSLGIFEVVNSERLSVMRETCHSIDYVLVGYGMDNDRLKDLFSKVITESVFVKDFIYHGQNPILVKTDFDDLVVIQRQYVTMCRNYVANTYSHQYSTLLVPGQVAPTFDRFLAKAVHAHMDHRVSDRLKYVIMFNVEDDKLFETQSLWDVFRWQERSIFDTAFTKAGIVSARDFTKSPIFESIRYSGLAELVYPADAPDRVDNESWTAKKVPTPISGLDTTAKSRSWEALREDLAKSSSKPVEEITDEMMYTGCGIKPVHQGGYYIFSKEFYENSGNQSRLEAVANKFIDRQPITFNDVRWLVDRAKYWSPVESFFYTPVLIILMKAAIRSI